MRCDQPDEKTAKCAKSQNRTPSLRDYGRWRAQEQADKHTHRPAGPAEIYDANNESNREAIEKCGYESSPFVRERHRKHEGHGESAENQARDNTESGVRDENTPELLWLNDSSCPPGHDTPIRFKAGPPAASAWQCIELAPFLNTRAAASPNAT